MFPIYIEHGVQTSCQGFLVRLPKVGAECNPVSSGTKESLSQLLEEMSTVHALRWIALAKENPGAQDRTHYGEANTEPNDW